MNHSDDSQGVGLPIGTKIGRYEIQQRIAIGGQSIIYRANDPGLQRCVAVKQLSSHLAEDRKFLDRFRREAQILARLGAEQPSIVDVHDLVECPEGLFIVMEWLEGPTLERILEDTAGPIEPKAVLQVLFRLAAAMYDVHRAGIVHRDLKPSNIIICEGLYPKITDFGVAATSGGQTSMRLGSTRYMAPELFEGPGADGRADVYSLGMIAYEMLIGRPKFREVFAEIVRDPHSESMRWMKWHADPAAQAPPLHEVNPAIPPSLSAILQKMMAKDREQRFQTTEQLGRAIKGAFSPRSRAGGSTPQAGGEFQIDDQAAELKLPEDTASPATDQAPTAAVPRKRLGRRARIALALSAAAVVLGVFAFVLVRSAMRSGAETARARQQYQAAQDLYRQGSYEQARAGFAAVEAGFPDSAFAARAGVLGELARARSALAAAPELEGWDQQALAAADRAATALEQIQRGRDDLDEWAQRTEGDVDRFRESIAAARIFFDAIDRSDQSLEKGLYDQARQWLLSGDMERIALSEAQQAQVDKRLRTIRRAHIHSDLAAALNQGKALCDQARKTHDEKEFSLAQQALAEAAVLIEGERVAVLEEDERAEYLQRLQALREVLATERTFRQHLIAANQAREDEDRMAELSALEQALEIRDDEQLRARRRGVLAESLYRRGNEELQAGRGEVALASFQQALEADPDHAGARAAAEQLRKQLRRDALISAGRGAMQKQNYDAAVENFTAALELGEDEDLRQKLAEARFQGLLAAAETHVEQKQWSRAVEACEAARQVLPDRSGAVDERLEEIRRLEEFHRLLDAGAAAMDSGSYSIAEQNYNAACGLFPEDAAARLGLLKARYFKYVQQGRQALEADNAKEALAYFQLARRQVAGELAAEMTTDEVDALIEKARDRLDEEG